MDVCTSGPSSLCGLYISKLALGTGGFPGERMKGFSLFWEDKTEESNMFFALYIRQQKQIVGGKSSSQVYYLT